MIDIVYHKTFCKICDTPLIVYATEECPKEILEEIIYNRLIKKDKLLDDNLFNYDDFCFYCDKYLNDNEKHYYNTVIGKVVVCKNCLSRLE